MNARPVTFLSLLASLCLLFGFPVSAGEPAQRLFSSAAARQVRLRALSDGRVVAWSAGALRFRSATASGWLEVMDVGPGRIEDVVSDVDGTMILVEHPGQGGDVFEEVLLLDPSGRPKDKWRPEGLVCSVASGGGQRWATMLPKEPGLRRRQTDQVLSLESGGAIHLVEEVPHRTHVVWLSTADRAGARLYCTEKDATVRSARLPFCRLAEVDGWTEDGQWDDPPIACGVYSIEVLDRGAGAIPFPKGSRPQVAVRRLVDGAVVTKARLTPGSIVACAAPDRLLIGRDDVRALSLPELKVIWRLPSPDGRVVAMAPSGGGTWIAGTSGRVRLLAPRSSASAR